MRKLSCIAGLLLLFCVAAFSQYVSYWFQGWQKQGNPQDAQEYFMREGTNVSFSYASNRVYINVAGVISNYAVATNAAWAMWASNAIGSEWATNWTGSNALWILLTNQINYATNGAEWFTNVWGIQPGTNVWFTTNLSGGEQIVSINASNTGGGGPASSISFTNVYDVAAGTNIIFYTNAGIVYIAVGTNYSPPVLDTNSLLAWWQFEEGSGTNAEDSADSYSGYLTNFTVAYSTTNNPSWTSGKIGNFALQFNASLKQFVAVPTMTTQNIAGTIAWWQYQTQAWNTASTKGLWGWFTNSTHEWDCQVFYNGIPSQNRWYIGAGNTPETRLNFLADATNWPVNAWIHYAFTWGTNGQCFYTNGIICASNVLNSGTNLISPDYLHIGELGKNSLWFSGQMDDFRIYITNLTAQQVYDLYGYYQTVMNSPQYVQKAGDTMTGPLTIESGALTVVDTIHATSNILVGSNLVEIAYSPSTGSGVMAVGGANVLTASPGGAGAVNLGIFTGLLPQGCPASVSVGVNAGAVDFGIAIGNLAIAWTNAIAIGVTTTADDYGIAIGNGATTSSEGIAIGPDTYADLYSIAIGTNARAPISSSIAIGSNAVVGNVGANIAIGASAQATGSNSVAIGGSGDSAGGLALVDGPAYEAFELGSGIATVPGALHYRGVAICNSNGVLIGTFSGDGSGIINIYGSNIVGAVSEATHSTNADNATYSTYAEYATNWYGLSDSNLYHGAFSGNGANITNIYPTNITWGGTWSMDGDIIDGIDSLNASGGSFTNILYGGLIGGDGSSITNIQSTNLPSWVAYTTSNQTFTANNAFTASLVLTGATTGYLTNATGGKYVSLGANGVGIGKTAASGVALDVTGEIDASTIIYSPRTASSGTGQLEIWSRICFSAPANNQLCINGIDKNKATTNIYLGPVSSTNIFLNHIPATTPTLSILGGSGGLANAIIAGLLTVTNGITVPTGPVTATNFVTSAVKWIDIPMNYSFSVLGPNAPALTAVTNGSVIQELAFDNNDILYAQAQMQHNVATTNAAFPDWYFEPHVHFTTIGTLDSTHSNVTWRIEWEFANINGAWAQGTNSATMGVTNNYTHYMLELGHITNNTLPHLSAVFRCRLMRPASATQDYSNDHDVLLDAFDLHIPVGNENAIGSSSDNAP